jgi:Ca-activated chloride channel family protein
MLFEFKYIWFFFLLPLPLIVRWLLPAYKKRRTALLHPRFKSKAELLKQQPKKSAWVSKRNFINELVLWLVWILVIGAAAHPQLTGQPEI